MKNGVAQSAANVDQAWIGTDAAGHFSKAIGGTGTVGNDADAAGIAEMQFGAGKGVPGVGMMVTLGTGIGSALFVDGELVPNTELGHLKLGKHDAERVAAESVREQEGLSWKQWAGRLDDYFDMLERLFSPDLIIVGGGISKKSDKFLPRLSLSTKIVPAQLLNEAGIVGAALAAAKRAPAMPPTYRHSEEVRASHLAFRTCDGPEDDLDECEAIERVARARRVPRAARHVRRGGAAHPGRPRGR